MQRSFGMEMGMLHYLFLTSILLIVHQILHSHVASGLRAQLAS